MTPELSVGIEAAPATKERSLLIIKNGELRLLSEVLTFAHDWCVGHDLGHAMVRNTPDGAYEIFAVEADRKLE